MPLTDPDVRNIYREGLDSVSLSGKRVLVLIPDHTRHARIDTFFHIIVELTGEKTKVGFQHFFWHD